jgi:hypothetical protein
MADLTLFASVPGEPPYPVNGAYYLAVLGLNPNDFYMDVYLLLGFGLLFFVLAFLVLAFAQKEKR